MNAQIHGPVVPCGTRRILTTCTGSLSDLDAEFGEWLAEAHDVGDGGHLARPAPG
jgi:hypothetical protein